MRWPHAPATITCQVKSNIDDLVNEMKYYCDE